MDFLKYGSRPKPKPFRGQKMSPLARCEPKYDGHRMTIARLADGSHYAAGRKPELNLWLEVKECLDLEEMPPGTALDGELHFDGPASSVVTRIKDGHPLLFSVFAVPYYAGRDLRYEPWPAMDAAFDALGLPMPYKATKKLLGGGNWRDINLASEAARLGIEGFVIKEFPYHKWWKTKPVQTIDLIVHGFEPGQGKLRGRNGALHLMLFDRTHMGSVGTGNDELWRDLKPHQMVGRVVEVGYEGFASNGLLKFPRFIRWRDDKNPQECIREQC